MLNMPHSDNIQHMLQQGLQTNAKQIHEMLYSSFIFYLFIYFTAQVLKICRTPGPNFCFQVASVMVAIQIGKLLDSNQFCASFPAGQHLLKFPPM